MPARAADPRLGHFTEAYTDFGTDLKPNQRVHYVQRWRLEKQDPQAPLSEPVQPIIYWLDRNIPAKYRASVSAGMLEWNKAFEHIGFKNAIGVKQQPDDADFDTLDVAPRVDPLDRRRRRRLRRIGPSQRRPAQRRDPRRRHRHRATSSRSSAPRAPTSRILGRHASRSTSASARRAAACGRARCCTTRRRGAASSASRSTCSRRAATSTPDSPEAEAFVHAVPEGRR